MVGGIEWLVDATGCRADALRDLTLLRHLCEFVIRDMVLHPLDDGVWHRFPEPCGVTGFYLLTESHLACHTYPEVGLATFNVYCCRPRRAWPWREMLLEYLGAENVTVRELARGVPDRVATASTRKGGRHER